MFGICGLLSISVSYAADSLSITAKLLLRDTATMQIPELTAYVSVVQMCMKQENPIIPLQRSLTNEEQQVQAICLGNKEFCGYTKDKSGNALRSEVFGIYKARESDFPAVNKQVFLSNDVYKVEMFNYALNITSIALVALSQKQLLFINHYKAMQPELPQHLKRIAIALAKNNTEIKRELQDAIDETNPLMADTKTALNGSRCERSRHLCVAPTFVKGNKALWCIVDLTDLCVAGIRWTNLGETLPVNMITERKIQNEYITNCFCRTSVPLTKNDWKLNYMLTSNDGLRIADVSYNGKAVLRSAKLVDWHVSYSNTDGFGYSDAVGCPYFSSATVVAVESPKIADIVNNGENVGFSIEQLFSSEAWPQPCNYQYFQRYEFYNDGRFRVAAASIGRGCGNDGTYRPVFRIAFGGEKNQIRQWADSAYLKISNELWIQQKPTTRYDENGALFLFSNEQVAYKIIPANGQFTDSGRGDNAYIYFTANDFDKDEGESDLPTIGPCCNTDYHQGPEKFIEPDSQSLQDKAIVIWYVPQLKNDDTKGKEYCWAESKIVNGVYQTEAYPCVGGPMFVPVKVSAE